MVVSFLLGMAAMALLVAGGLFLALRVFRRGPQDFDCPGFYSHVLDADPGKLIREIQSDREGAKECRLDDPMACALTRAVAEGRKGNVLLLSGGGQWGAFGAGMFAALAEKDPHYLALPNIEVITGISTGSLQTMLLMVALDASQQEELRRLAMTQLIWGYSPDDEREVVKNTGLKSVPLYGAAATTDALRVRIKEALRPGGDNRLVEAIKASKIEGYVGFVEAESGLLRYADIGALARAAATPEAAAEALAAATMASSAMPVFHQQLRIAADGGKPLTLYDGGVRRSVFFDRAMEVVDRAVRAELASKAADKLAAGSAALAESYAETAPCVFVVRNGPTVRDREDKHNTSTSPIDAGKRGYDLLVNESELGAIAALRLNNPYGIIKVATADGFDTFPHTVGENFKHEEMFKPAFMACLRELGKWKVDRKGGPWITLSPLGR